MTEPKRGPKAENTLERYADEREKIQYHISSVQLAAVDAVTERFKKDYDTALSKDGLDAAEASVGSAGSVQSVKAARLTPITVAGGKATEARRYGARRAREEIADGPRGEKWAKWISKYERLKPRPGMTAYRASRLIARQTGDAANTIYDTLRKHDKNTPGCY